MPAGSPSARLSRQSAAPSFAERHPCRHGVSAATAPRGAAAAAALPSDTEVEQVLLSSGIPRILSQNRGEWNSTFLGFPIPGHKG